MASWYKSDLHLNQDPKFSLSVWLEWKVRHSSTQEGQNSTCLFLMALESKSLAQKLLIKTDFGGLTY